MDFDKWALLRRLHKAVKKVKFILSFNIGHRWRLASILGSQSIRRLSFNDRPGLREFSDGGGGDDELGASPKMGAAIERTRSCVSTTDEDIDNRAEMFIANFYKQLQIERQVSLELQYLRGNSLESTRSD